MRYLSAAPARCVRNVDAVIPTAELQQLPRFSVGMKFQGGTCASSRYNRAVPGRLAFETMFAGSN